MLKDNSGFFFVLFGFFFKYWDLKTDREMSQYANLSWIWMTHEAWCIYAKRKVIIFTQQSDYDLFKKMKCNSAAPFTGCYAISRITAAKKKNKKEKVQRGFLLKCLTGVQWPVPSPQRLYGWLEEGKKKENAPFSLQVQFMWQM